MSTKKSTKGGNGSGLLGDLRDLANQVATEFNTARKRKQSEIDCDCDKKIVDFHNKMYDLMKNSTDTPTKISTEIRNEINKMHTECKMFRNATENLQKDFALFKTELDIVKSENIATQSSIQTLQDDVNKLKILEKEVKELESSETERKNKKRSPSRSVYNKDIIIELEKRAHRQYNILFVGICEINNKDPSIRRQHDKNEIMRALSVLDEKMHRAYKSYKTWQIQSGRKSFPKNPFRISKYCKIHTP
ncbi:hypothetical protein O0L34_g19427 [Tuta absoluta]|nr:hypothetical protein O0L34_g19427 [Tuta absoluta]